MKLHLSPRTIAGILLAIAITCSVLGGTGQVIELLTQKENVMGLAAFDLNEESTISAWYASALLLLSALLLFFVALSRKGKRFQKHWWGLMVIFIYLSIDEALAVHETVKVARVFLSKSSFLYSDAWVFVGGAGVALVFLIYRKMLWQLPAQIKGLILLAGTIYVGGAIGMEVVAGYFQTLWGKETLAHVSFTIIEESLEMLGVITFIYGLLLYLSRSKVQISLDPSDVKDAIAESDDSSAAFEKARS